MGVDFHVYSKVNPEMFAKEDMNQYLNYALRHVNWSTILELLNMNLFALNSNRISYWCPEQVKDMYESIKALYDDPENVLCSDEPDQEMLEKANVLHEDTKVVMDYFEYLVKNEAYIRVI
jgi:hypothetical protein